MATATKKAPAKRLESKGTLDYLELALENLRRRASTPRRTPGQIDRDERIRETSGRHRESAARPPVDEP